MNKIIFLLVISCLAIGFVWGYSISFAYGQYQGNVGPLELQQPPIPTWIKHVFELWTLDKITDTELINAIQYLVDIEVIQL